MKRNAFLVLIVISLFSCGNPEQPSISLSEDSSSTLPSEEESSSIEEHSSAASSLEESSSIEEEKRLSPLDEPYVGEQYYLNHIGDIYSAWEKYRGKGVTIAVIDAGFNPYHEDFYYSNGESKVSPLSASFVTSGSDTQTQVGVENVINMGDSHGTFCAGVAAAAINGKGIVGIAPEADLLLLKTDLKPKSIAKAMRYAADNNAKVITISIGSYYDYGGDLVNDGSNLSEVFVQPVAYARSKGTLVISAGGNGGLEGKPMEYTYPAATEKVIGVGGLSANSSLEVWSGSSFNYSPEHSFVDVFAPSDDMFGCCHYDGKTYDGGWQGTSFASPIVAGMAALYREKNPNKNDEDFESALYASCHMLSNQQLNVENPSDNHLGYGRVDVGRLLNISRENPVKVQLKASWQSAYCYAFNSVSGQNNSAWPGERMQGENGLFLANIDPKQFDSLVFNAGASGPQSADILVSSFASGKIYDIRNVDYNKGYGVGRYI